MILILTEIFNKTDKNFIKIYEKNIVNCFHKLIRKCPYCHSSEIVGNGYYSRYLFYNDTINYVDIYRVKCKNCGKSHALFTLDLIPWFICNAKAAHEFLVKNKIISKNELLNEEIKLNIKKRIKLLRIKYTKILNLNLNDSLESINRKIIYYEQSSFLQIHRGNIFLNMTYT